MIRNTKFQLYYLKVSANVKIAIQYFENFGRGKCPKYPLPGCTPEYCHASSADKQVVVSCLCWSTAGCP